MSWTHLAVFVAGILAGIWLRSWRRRPRVRTVVRTCWVEGRNGRTLVDIDRDQVANLRAYLDALDQPPKS